jgi:hypothetical protein
MYFFVYNIRNIKNKKGFIDYNFIYNRIFTYYILFIYNISGVPIYQYLEFPDLRLWFKYNRFCPVWVKGKVVPLLN